MKVRFSAASPVTRRVRLEGLLDAGTKASQRGPQRAPPAVRAWQLQVTGPAAQVLALPGGCSGYLMAFRRRGGIALPGAGHRGPVRLVQGPSHVMAQIGAPWHGPAFAGPGRDNGAWSYGREYMMAADAMI